MAGRVHIGTSGWSYRGWRPSFYPSDLPRGEELRYLAERTTSVEVNASFYRQQTAETYARWAAETPSDYVFSVKASRYVTHRKRLLDPERGVAAMVNSGLLRLGDKLDVVLWQLPRNLRFETDRIRPFLATLPRSVRHAVEPRHPSFKAPEAADLFRARGVAMVWSDGAGQWPVLDRDTAAFRYVRLHGHSELYASRYAERTLASWAERCRSWSEEGRDVYVYFDNDARGHAPHDAMRLIKRLEIS